MSASDPGRANTDARVGPRITRARVIVQAMLFAACLALLGWCVAKVLAPDNRENLQRVLRAPPAHLASLLGLSVLVVLLSGAAFRQALTPVRRLPMLDVQAVNAVASLLALLPFKLSIIFRMIVHNRRDGVPLLTIGAWLACVAAIMGAVLAPVILVSVWHGRIDALWVGWAAAGVGACLGLLIGTARVLRAERSWAWVESMWSRMPLPGFVRRSTLLERAHEGVRMLASPGAVLSCAGLRVGDLAVQTARFMVAGAIIGTPFPADQAVLAGSSYFLIGAVAPAGQVGAREGGTAAIIRWLFPDHDLSTLFTAVLAISAAEAIVLVVMSALGLVVLRPRRARAAN